jgi:type VI secretion system secreted protein VgrG
MSKYSQAGRVLAVATPLGSDVLLLQSLAGHEAISQLFRFELELLADSSTAIAFDQILGQNITVAIAMPEGQTRYLNGIVSRFCQRLRVPSAQGKGTLTRYRAEVVPLAWVLTKKVQSRIFQQLAIPDILKKVLADISVSYKLMGEYQPRDYCVQYRESDFAFASRLMEEEGIYYYFTHNNGSHQMVVADTPQGHADVPGAKTVIFEEILGGTRAEDRVFSWEKTQEVRAGKYRLWDSCFELPGKNLEATQPTLDSVQVGEVVHKLKVAGNDALEIYDYPGGYAQRFDGVAPGGAERPSDITKIFEDNKRTVAIRMQQETAKGLRILGTSSCRQFGSGCKFTLERHFDANGPYVLTHVEHHANVGDAYTTGNNPGEPYSNFFECIPAALPFKPAQETPRPKIDGPQTAVVVGALPVEQIFTDKYGRVKVQFFWDREGKFNADSSCWIRVATAWAGKGWGQINIPRIGHEVIVDFLEGDPDQPIIVGSVYNAENMPAKKLPEGKKTSGLVTRTNDPSVPGYNMITCDDSDGKEMIKIHGQFDMETTLEHDDRQHVINNRKIDVDGTHTETIKKDTTIKISEGNLDHNVVKGTASYHVAKAVTENFDATQDTVVKNNILIKSAEGEIRIDASKKITLHTGDSELVMEANGTITLTGKIINTIGKTSITDSAPKCEYLGGDTAKLGVGHQNIICDKAKANVSGAAINSSAVGMHEITGALVKIN